MQTSSQPDLVRPSDDKVEEMFESVLDHLLTAPPIKKQLKDSQSIEKKWMTVTMHKQLFEGQINAKSVEWGEKDVSLLASIEKSKTPDINSLTRLKISLSSANRGFMEAFLAAGGVSVILKALEVHLARQQATELDIAIMFELMTCCKAIMNNAVGMEGLLSVDGAVNVIARCLRFDFKAFALLVLEILSVCCYYSDRSTTMVIQGMRQQAKMRMEAPFGTLIQALLSQDVEVKAAVLLFLNSMIMGVTSVDDRAALRNDLDCQLLGESFDKAASLLRKELEELKHCSDSTAATPDEKHHRNLRRRSLVSMYGPRAYDEQKVSAALKSSVRINDRGSLQQGGLEVKSGKKVVLVNPGEGTMAGLLVASKNAEKLETKFLDILGGKKTKRRWYELDAERFKWCAGHDKDEEFKGFVSVSTITDVRPYSADANLLATNPHSFEIETTERVFALGCETIEEKDHWVTAVRTCRDNYILTKGSYRLQFRELTTADVYKFADNFFRQGDVYHSIAVEDRRLLTASNGLNMSNLANVLGFLRLESLAAGVSDKLLAVASELLLIPPGAIGVWDSALIGLRRLREKLTRAPEASPEDFPYVELANDKASAGGGGYAQVSKLALAALANEQEVERLQQTIRDQEAHLDQLCIEKLQLTAQLAEGGGGQIISSSVGAAPESTHPEAPKELPPPPPMPEGEDPETNQETEEPSTSQEPQETTPSVDPRYEKYVKMKKMLPEGAVRQKMTVDGFSEEEIDAFISGAAPTVAGCASAPAQADPRYEKYSKMKKMLPEGAVRQKMTVDGFTEEEIDAFMNGAVPTVPGGAPPPPPTADPRYEKYAKMKKMLPEGAVRQKMSVDGFSDAEIDAFMSGAAPPPAAPAPAGKDYESDPRFAKFVKMKKILPEMAVRQKMSVEGFSEVEIEAFIKGEAPPSATSAKNYDDDPLYVKFVKMKKMLPEGAVRQKMSVEGFSEEEIHAFFGGTGAAPTAKPKGPPKSKAPVEEPPPEGMSKKPKINPPTKMKGLFWTKIKNTDINGTVWHKLEEPALSSENQELLASWFGAKTVEKKEVDPAALQAKANTPKLLSLLDGKRTQNVLIIMGKVRMEAPEILKLVVDLDPSALTLDLALTIYEILPTAEELAQVKVHKDPSKLDKASQMLFHFNRLPRVQIRVECHITAFTWFPALNNVTAALGVIDSACNELKSSEKQLKVLLAQVLAIGNYINGGTARGQAYGVKLETLAKFGHLKSPQGTLMHFLALSVEQRYPDILQWDEQCVALFAAAEISWKQIAGDLHQLQTQYTRLENEFGKIKDSRENLGLDGVKEDIRGTVTNAYHRRLDGFLFGAKPKLEKVKAQSTAAQNAVKAMMVVYGEDKNKPEEGDPTQLFFRSIADFARQFRSAVDENKAKKEAAEKEAAAQKAKSNKQMERQSSVDSKKDSENLFGQFHSAQGLSPDAVVAEFKMKLMKRQQQAQ